jgi:hypothetical protein
VLFLVYGAVMSRTHVPAVHVVSTVANSPTVELIGVNDESMTLLKTYSGLLADSVAPDGEMVKIVFP